MTNEYNTIKTNCSGFGITYWPTTTEMQVRSPVIRYYGTFGHVVLLATPLKASASETGRQKLSQRLPHTGCLDSMSAPRVTTSRGSLTPTGEKKQKVAHGCLKK